MPGKKIIFDNAKQCACENAVARVGVLHVQRCEDAVPHLGCWTPDLIGGSQCSIQIYAREVVTCQSCGKPWGLQIKVFDDEEPGDRNR